MTPIPHRLSATLLSLVAGTLVLAACSRNDDSRTVGQRVDQTIAKVERKSDEAGAEMRAAGRDVSQAARQAVDSVGTKSKDLAITAEVNARLASDAELSALAINVDTTDGSVMLRGTAPDSAARARAAQLARTVDGVVAVNNGLSVTPR